MIPIARVIRIMRLQSINNYWQIAARPPNHIDIVSSRGKRYDIYVGGHTHGIYLPHRHLRLWNITKLGYSAHVYGRWTRPMLGTMIREQYYILRSRLIIKTIFGL